MKIKLNLIIVFLIVGKISASNMRMNQDPYLFSDLLASVEKISISKLLDYKKIAIGIKDEFDNARFHYVIAYEIDNRLNALDNKFKNNENKYVKVIRRYEDELEITPYKYTNDRPAFDYQYAPAEITQETIDENIHKIQANVARAQFVRVYKYYRKRLDNYKNYIRTLRELYSCKVQENKDNKVEFYSNFPQMYQGIKLFHDAMDDAGQMQVHRDVLGKVRYIDWNEDDEKQNTRRRSFEYYNDGTLSKLTDTIDNNLIYETLFGENKVAENFLNYVFSSGFIPRNYSYYTEIYYSNNKPTAYKFSTMEDHVIGTIYKEYNDKDHLIKEAWCKGETSKLLREFSSIFDASSGGYKLIERDKNGNIVNQEIVLSSND